MTTIVICITIISVVAIVCYTRYQERCSDNRDAYKQDLQELKDKLRWVDVTFHNIENFSENIHNDLDYIKGKVK